MKTAMKNNDNTPKPEPELDELREKAKLALTTYVEACVRIPIFDTIKDNVSQRVNDSRMALQKLTEKEFLTTEDVAAVFGVDVLTVINWRKHRGLPHCKLTTKVVRFKREDVIEWADSKRLTLTVPE